MTTNLVNHEPGGAPDDDFCKHVLLWAQSLGVKFHEETNAAGSRFTAILPDTRSVWCLPYAPRREAVSRICRALAPYLKKLSVDKDYL